MKKLILTLSMILLTLTACGSTSNGADPQGGSAGELPATTQLIVGTFKLEETENAVTAEQAAELLPLWQTMQVLSQNDTVAKQETKALVTQIQETMTVEQMQAITAMKLTREDMMAVMQEQGMAMGGPTGQNTNSPNGNTNSGGGFRPGGEFPGGPPPGGFAGGAGGGGSGLTPDQIATAQASRQQGGGGNFVPPGLINALIEYLKQKAGS